MSHVPISAQRSHGEQRARLDVQENSAITVMFASLLLSIAAPEPEIAAAGWAPRLHETLRAAEAVRSDVPFLVPTAGEPPQNLTLGIILQPFANKLAPPFVKLTRGAGGESTARADLPRTLDEVVEMMTRPSDPWSVMLRLEELDPANDSMLPLFTDLLTPVLPLSSKRQRNTTTTAHVYISGPGAPALPNHTDVTEIVVLQLLGRKKWLYCQASRAPQVLRQLSPSRGSQAREVRNVRRCRDEQRRARMRARGHVTGRHAFPAAPHGPQRTRRRRELLSVHLTVSITPPRRGTRSEDEAAESSMDDSETRRLQTALHDCTTSCDAICTAQCDDMGCDNVASTFCNGDCLCDGASCDGSGCDDAGCDDASCDDAGCDEPGCDQSCDAGNGGCDDGCDWNTYCDYDGSCDYDSGCDYDGEL